MAEDSVPVLKTAVEFAPYRAFESHSLRTTALSHVARSEGKPAGPGPGLRRLLLRLLVSPGIGHPGLPVMGGVQLTRPRRYPNGDLVCAMTRPRLRSIWDFD